MRRRTPVLIRKLPLLVAGGALLLAPALGAPVDSAAQTQSAEAAPAPAASVAFDTRHARPAVPQRFLGLSFEVASLPQLARYAHLGDLVPLLRSLGPGVLRFGGITADEVVGWSDASTPGQAWASSTIDPSDLAALGQLARRSGWQVLLTVGLGHVEPEAAAHEVAAAHAALGSRLAGIEIGNEPDAYGKHGLRPALWIAQGYEEEVSAYREAIDALTPGVPIAGPDTSSGVWAEWGEEEALGQSPALLTGHYYPFACTQVPAPSIEALLSASTREREARSLGNYLAVARRHGIPLRIDETNSVSCGGLPGISDTVASALWATGYIAQTMSAGLAGINLHGNIANCAGYTPLCAQSPADLAAGRLHAEPVWYALRLARSLVGTRPLPTTVAGESASELLAAAFEGPGSAIQILLVDDQMQGAPLSVRVGVGAGARSTRLQRLTAASVSAIGRVSLSAGPAECRSGTVTLELPAASAALLSVGGPAGGRHHGACTKRRGR
jgi:hypothetical protein